MLSNLVFLVGPMGAGKTTIGKILSETLGLSFLDMDHIIEERCGADIAWIFDVEGESGFRERESNLLQELIDAGRVGVVATGGGVVELERNRALLSTVPNVVFLNASSKQLVERTAKDKKRPLLQVDNPAEKIRELYQRRFPLYSEVADIVVATDGKSPKTVAQEIAAQLQ